MAKSIRDFPIENKHYLYRHIRLDKNEPFYIGIGTKPISKNYMSSKTEYARAYVKSAKSSFWNKVVSKTDYRVDILLESNDYEFIKEKEKEFIKLYGKKSLNKGSLVNLTDGGEGFTGFIPSKETRQKIRIANSKRIVTEAQKELLRNYQKGVKQSEETIKKKTISLLKRGDSFKGVNHPNSIPVFQYNLYGDFIKKWNCCLDIQKELKIYHTSILSCLASKNKITNGYFWSKEFLGEKISIFIPKGTRLPVIMEDSEGVITNFNTMKDAVFYIKSVENFSIDNIYSKISKSLHNKSLYLNYKWYFNISKW